MPGRFWHRWMAAFAALLGGALASPALAEPRPFRLVGNQILFPVTIEGHETLALLDTAAGGSLISDALAERLGIRHRRMVGAGTVGVSGERIRSSITPKLRVGLADGIEVGRRLRVFPAGAAFVSGAAEAIVGADLLRDTVVVIDFDRQTIDIALSRQFESPHAPGIPFSSWYKPAIKIGIAGRNADLRIDTAASSALHLSAFFAEELPAIEALRKSETLVIGSDGSSAQPIFSLPNVEIAGVTFEDVPATIGARDHLAGLIVGDGVVGVDLLKRFNLVIDFRRSRLWMAPNAHSEAPFRRNRIGVVTGEGGLVLLVAPGSPAEAEGFAVGDRIVRFQDETGAAIPNLMDLPDGAPVTAVMADGSSRRLLAEAYY